MVKKAGVPIWENLGIVGNKKEAGHALAFSYNTAEAAFSSSPPPCRLCLDGKWRFLHVNGSQVPGNVADPAFDDRAWDEIDVPGVWQIKGYGTPYYYATSYPQAIGTKKKRIPKISHGLQEVGIYRRRFMLPNGMADKVVYLHFGAAKAALEVYVNGKYVGYSLGSMTPHEFNVTSWLQPGENQVTAIVWRYSVGTYLEDQDMWFFSGIYRDVFLYAERQIHLWDHFMKAEFEPGMEQAEVNLALYLRNGGIPGTVTVRAEIPELDLVLGEESLTVDREACLCFSKQVQHPRLWSHETPHLYSVLITLTCAGESTYKIFRFGFRKVEIQGNVLLLNEKPLKIRGVNRHDFNPDTGWTLSDEQYRQDVEILKRLNINSIRTSHYPNDPRLYDLCDEYGILVMDEADLESHGVREILPASDPRWTPHCLDRMRRMVLRDRNHACVLFWSLGNEAGTGANFAAMRKAAEELDDTRLFHYEGEYNRSSSDLVSRMYPDESAFAALCLQQELGRDGSKSNPLMDENRITPDLYASMPVLLCEYAHCMENSLGNLAEYTQAFEKYPHLCGGYIWDFVDQSLRQTINGEEHWLYGSDFKERYHLIDGHKNPFTTGSNGYFCANGILAANRKLHPAAYEVKHCYQLLEVQPIDLSRGCYRLHNKQMFSTLAAYRLTWTVEINGIRADEGEVQPEAFAATAPGTSCEISLAQDKEWPSNALVTITFRWFLKADTAYANAGYEQASDQIILQERQPVSHPANFDRQPGSLRVEEKDGNIMVYGEGFSCWFRGGCLIGYTLQNQEFIHTPLKPNYYRAETDNDRGAANFMPALLYFTAGQKWKRASRRQQSKKMLVRQSGQQVEILVNWQHPLLKQAETRYCVWSDGSIEVDHMATSKKLDMMRCGVSLALPLGFNQVEWLGRGPHENYADRKSGAFLSRYHSDVAGLAHHYMRPQENGTRCDVSELSISNGQHRLFVQDLGSSGLFFSAWHYTTEALDAAEHIHQLPNEPFTTLNIDGAMCGVGGDLPGQAALHPPYILKSGSRYSVHFLMRFMRLSEESR